MADLNRSIDTLPELYQSLSLADVALTEYSARHVDEGDGPADPMVELLGHSWVDDDAQTFLVAMSVLASGFGAEYKVTTRAAYTIKDGARWSNELEVEFVRTSSFITLAPYLREALGTLGSRINRASPWLPLQGPHAPETLEVTVEVPDSRD